MARFVVLEDVVKWLRDDHTVSHSDEWDYNGAALEIVAEKLESGEWQKELNEAEAKDNEALPPR